MSRLPFSLINILAVGAICAAHQPAAIAKAFSWHIDRNGELVTVPVDTPPAPAPDPSTASPPPSDAIARTSPTPNAPQSASTPGLILGLLLSGSGYVFGKQLYRRLKRDKATRQTD